MKVFNLLKFVIVLLLFPVMLNAQVFSSGFENDLNTDWHSDTSGTGLPIFEINTASKYQGSNGFHMEFNQAEQKGNLWTPRNIDWKNGATYTISFYYKALVQGTNSEPNIKIFSSDGTKLEQLNFTLSSTDWVKYSANFTSTLDDDGGYVLFSMRPNDNETGEFYFDDFLIEETQDNSAFFNSLRTTDVDSDSSIVWQQFGPGMSGNNKGAQWHPTDSDILYIAPNMGNAYRSTDRGFTYETMMDEDGPSYNTGLRGPRDFTSLDFSRQNPDYGFCTDENNKGIFHSTDKGKTWELQDKFGDSYLSCVTVDPNNENIWFVGAGRMRNLGRILFPLAEPHGIYTDDNSEGKIWKSTDKGVSWTLKNAGLDSKADVETIIIDPENSSTIYASTNYGFYKSTDSGDSWVRKNVEVDGLDVIRSFTMHHNTTSGDLTFYVISSVMWEADGTSIKDASGGIFKSTDRGETWQKVNGNIALDMTQFSSNNDVKKSYYGAVSYFFGITSSEAETTYSTLPSSITQRFNTITVDPMDPNNVYVNNMYSNASDNNFKPGQIWRSKDGGANWYVTFRNGTNWDSGSDIAYWQGRGNPIGSNVTIKYLSHWMNRDEYERKSCNFMKFNADGTVLHTQMAKISLMSYNGGDTWVDIDDQETSTPESYVGAGNSNVPGHGFFQHELIEDKVFCSAGENTLWVTNNEGDEVRTGAQAATSYKILDDEQSLSSYTIHPTNVNIHYALFFRQAGKGKLYRSLDAGANWEHIGTPIPEWPTSTTNTGGDQSVHQISFIIDKTNPDYMYFCVPQKASKIQYVGDSVGEWGIFKSVDGGVNWTKPNTGLPSSLDVTAIALDPNDSSILYATIQGTDGGLFKSVDRGENWLEVDSAAALLSRYGVNDIHFSKDGLVYITTGHSWWDENEGGLWVSNDGMETWERIFDFPWVFRVETANYDPKTILISTLGNNATDNKNPGTYLSKDGGESWLKINKGNGQSDRINDIAINYSVPGKYYVSTYGSGWYVATDPNPNEPDTTLSIDEFEIIGVSETCRDSDNGSIKISTDQTLNYKAILNGESISKTEDFSNSINFEDLKSGSYNLCIQVEEKPGYEACYIINIVEPDELGVSSKVDTESNKVSISLNGAKKYFVTLNNKTIVTSKSNLDLDLVEGENILEVRTETICQGEHLETIVASSFGNKVYPNPVSNELNISGLTNDSYLKIFSFDGKLQMHFSNISKGKFDLSSLKTGLYFYSVHNSLQSKSGKFIKL
ncbi:T9SS type A sorting domain-containing protein [Lutibacter sp. TH_r2]|uniref:T9SS type A sorting domain-containing protein n=1 Tax=Lutibacter sp. TH_r2 TaxID=3082083 RepID=UPI0029554204|nr:T9SS type A sorting domain-containing protein [Lutibacter sp. TH_r2]MDV7185922.1 T9SS type A sorting domain-containing protein [Lutibacter sp. TH_r2]